MTTMAEDLERIINSVLGLHFNVASDLVIDLRSLLVDSVVCLDGFEDYDPEIVSEYVHRVIVPKIILSVISALPPHSLRFSDADGAPSEYAIEFDKRVGPNKKPDNAEFLKLYKSILEIPLSTNSNMMSLSLNIPAPEISDPDKGIYILLQEAHAVVHEAATRSSVDDETALKYAQLFNRITVELNKWE